MPIDIVKPVAGSVSCERCGDTSVPVATFIERQEDWHVSLCPLCLAEAIFIVTQWDIPRLIRTYTASSALKERHADPDADPRGRHNTRKR